MPERRRRSRARAAAPALLGLFGLLLLLPSANVHRLDGLPLSRLPEFLGLVLLVPFVASAALRRRYGAFLRRAPALARHGLLGLAVGAVAAKLLLLASGTHVGFLACYRSPVAPPPAGPCERSYENPFGRFGVTRLDRRLDFAPAGWDLSFVNSLRFNIYPWIKGNVLRDRLPLAATWTGTVEHSRDWTAEIGYVGEAAIRVGSTEPVRLPARYDALGVAAVPMPAGRHRLTVEYRFDDGSRVGDGRSYGPYATFRLLRARGPGEKAVPVRAVRPPRPWRVTGAMVDVVAVLLAATLAAALAGAVAPDAWILAVVAIAAPAGYYADGRLPPTVPPGVWILPVLALPFACLVAGGRLRRLLTSYVAIGIGVFFLALGRFARLDVVGYRAAGDDWLTYESFARSILETWSLRGAEDVFYYQPLFRYVRFGEHFVLGDGDPFILIAAMVTLCWGLFWMVATIRGRRRPARPRSLLLAVCGLFLLALACSPTVVGLIQTGISEYPTWLLLPFLLPLLFVSTSSGRWLWGAALLGASLLARTNHLPAVAGLLVLFLWRGGHLRPRAAIGAGLLFGAIALLPGLHNYHYGGRLVPLTTSAGIPENLVLPPGRLRDLGHDPDVQARLWSQVKRMAYVTDAPDRVLELAVRGLQLMWVLSLAALLLGHRPGVVAGLLLGAPALYLVPHLFYQATHGYPRHFLIGYLAMGAVVLLAWAARPGGSRQPVARD